MCEVSILRITILVEHISPHSLYAYTTLSARQAGEILKSNQYYVILQHGYIGKYIWEILKSNQYQKILEHENIGKYVWKILKSSQY